MTTEEHNFNERLTVLENEIKYLKSGAANKSDDKEKQKKEKKEKKPRAQTEYNKFVSSYINDEKERLGESFNHKVAFGEAAKKWTTMKNEKEKEKEKEK